MAEHVVEDVGFLQIVELVRPADEIARDEAAIRHVIEKNIVRHQPRHRHHLPPGQLHKPFGQFLKIRDARFRQLQHVQPAQIGVRCAAGKQLGLAREQRIPGRMLLRRVMLPVLGDRPVCGGIGGGRSERVRVCGHDDGVT